MKKTIFAMAAILIAGLFTSCEKDSETPETPETETYRTLLTGDWYVTDWFGRKDITENSEGEFYSYEYTEADNFIISFDEDGTMTQYFPATGNVSEIELNFADLDSEAQYEVSIFGSYDGSSGSLMFENKESLEIFINLETMTSTFWCKRKL